MRLIPRRPLNESQLFRSFRRLRTRTRRIRRQTLNVGWYCGLPEDVLELIFEACFEMRNDTENGWLMQPTLCAATRVCWTWNKLATKYLYGDVYISSEDALQQFRDTSEKHACFQGLVRNFCFTFPVFASSSTCLGNDYLSDRNEQRVCDLCPNLALKSRMIMVRGLTSDYFKREFGAEYLTHLELMAPDCLSVTRWQFPLPSIELPLLQSLGIGYADVVHQWKFEWFRMPKLRRLALVGIQLSRSSALTLPEHSPLVDTIEILQCDIATFQDFFKPESTPLLPFRNTLRRLVVTGRYDDVRLFPKWSLGFLGGLTHLCLSFVLFRTATISDYPPNLAELALVSNIQKYFKEKDVDRVIGCLNLQNALVHRKENGLCNLRRVIVRVLGAEKEISKVEGVRLELGTVDMTDLLRWRWRQR